MSQTGELVFFTSSRSIDLPNTLERVLNLTEATSILSMSRSIGESRDFESFLGLLRDGSLKEESEDLEASGDFGKMKLLYNDNSCITIDVGDCPLCEQMDNAVGFGSSAYIKTIGDFYTNGVFVRIGSHEIYESSEHPEGFLIARPRFSIIFWGYGTPSDWDEARKLILTNPRVQKIKTKLEKATGQLDQCIYWSC